MFACFQSVGSFPVVRDVLNMIYSGMLMQFAKSCMTLGWSPSGPGDLRLNSLVFCLVLTPLLTD